MCVGGSPQGRRMERPASLPRLESPKVLSFGTEEELTLLRRQNASLVRQQQSHDRSLKQLKSELVQQHEEEVAQRVARHTHETASLVTRQEEQVQRIVQRYEAQLALQVEQDSNQAELEHLRRCLAEMQSRHGDARASFEAAETQAAKHKKKIQKLQAHRADEVRIMRRRLRSWISSASRRATKANAFLTWIVAVSAAALRQVEEQSVTQNRHLMAEAQRSFIWEILQARHPTLLAIVGSRPLLSALAALRAWAVAVATVRSQMELEAQLDQVSMKSTAALGALRSEALALRMAGTRSAKAAVQARSILQLAAPFAVWARTTALNPWNLRKQGLLDRSLTIESSSRGKGAGMVVRAQTHVTLVFALRAWEAAARDMRHAALLRGQLDEASMQSMAALAALRADARELRARGKRTAVSKSDLMALKALAAPFAAWSREMIMGRAKRRHTGEVVLNSGEAARRTMKQLEEVRAQCTVQVAQAQQQAQQQTSDAQRAAATASKRESKAVAVADRALCLVHQSQSLNILQVVFQAWRDTRNKIVRIDLEVDNLSELHADASNVNSAASDADIQETSRGDQRAAALVQHLDSVVHPEQDSALLHMVFKLWNLAGIATREVLAAEAEPTRRYLAEIQEMRASYDKQIAALRKKASDVQKNAITAIRKEARSRALAERSKKMLFQERAHSLLLGYFYAWITAGADVRHEQRLHTAVTEMEQRHEQAIACVRNESRVALKTAWSSSADAARTAAAYERRKAAEALLNEETRTNWVADSGQRPTTAAAIERQLEIADEDSRRKSGNFPAPIAPGFQILEIADESYCSRTQRRIILESMLGRQESQWIAGPFEVWRRAAADAKYQQAARAADASARETRESRKGLFIAALGQQVKYWQTNAFSGWRQASLEAKCQRLLAAHGQKRPKSGSLLGPSPAGSARAHRGSV